MLSIIAAVLFAIRIYSNSVHCLQKLFLLYALCFIIFYAFAIFRVDTTSNYSMSERKPCICLLGDLLEFCNLSHIEDRPV